MFLVFFGRYFLFLIFLVLWGRGVFLFLVRFFYYRFMNYLFKEGIVIDFKFVKGFEDFFFEI